MSDNSSRQVLTHVGAWAVFIFYEVSIILVINPPQTLWWEYLGYYFLNIGLFYLHAHGMLAYTFYKRNLPYLLLLLVPLELSLYTVLEYGLQYLYNLFRPEPRTITFDIKTTLAYVWRGIYFIGLSTAYWSVVNTIRGHQKISRLEVQRLEAEKERAELERNLARSQNAFLQAQINPHLLFNTLNFIYNAVQDTSPRASEGVMLLSEVMHYALGEVHEDGMTDLGNEVEHLQKYVALNQLRFSYPLQLSAHYSGSTQGHRIPPLILLTFVENAFKHGDLTDPGHPASVSLCCQNGQIHFRSRNKKRSQSVRKGYGIGIRNARTRLRDFYREEEYRLDIREDALYYAVDLKISKE